MCADERQDDAGSATRRLIRIGERQHNHASIVQARACGVTRDVVRRRVEAGVWSRPHVGVLRLGAGSTKEGEWMAAVLACGGGERALLDDGAAAQLFGFGGVGSPVTVVVPIGAPRGPATVITHRSRTLIRADATAWRGIPVTTPERTLVTRAASLSRDALEAELHEAKALGLLHLRSLKETMDRAGRPRGIATLRSLLDELFAGHTHRELERLFRAMARRVPFGPYLANHRIELPDRVIVADAYFSEARLIIELDGRGAHEWRFDRDRERDLAAALGGLLPVRLTWRMLTRDAATTEERVLRLLTQRRVADPASI